MIKRILLAYDGSDCAKQAAEYAKELALQFGSRVKVVYAFGPVPRTWGSSDAQDAIRSETNQGHVLIAAALERLQAAGIKAEGEVVEGMAADVVLHQAHQERSDLIVIGSQGLGRTTAFLLGSVSDKVVHDARCPVLVVK